MSELNHECGIAAIYHLAGKASPLASSHGPDQISRLLPRMLLDIQNRGQLSAGLTSYNPERSQLIDTFREVGSVSEVFRLNHQGKADSLMERYAGRAAIGHVRYATCGTEDRSYAQPFGLVLVLMANWPTTLHFVTSCWLMTITIWPGRRIPRSSCMRSVGSFLVIGLRRCSRS